MKNVVTSLMVCTRGGYRLPTCREDVGGGGEEEEEEEILFPRSLKQLTRHDTVTNKLGCDRLLYFFFVFFHLPKKEEGMPVRHRRNVAAAAAAAARYIFSVCTDAFSVWS